MPSPRFPVSQFCAPTLLLSPAPEQMLVAGLGLGDVEGSAVNVDLPAVVELDGMNRTQVVAQPRRSSSSKLTGSKETAA